jgi:hypothetical protein
MKSTALSADSRVHTRAAVEVASAQAAERNRFSAPHGNTLEWHAYAPATKHLVRDAELGLELDCGDSGRTGPIASKNCAVVACQSSMQRRHEQLPYLDRACSRSPSRCRRCWKKLGWS